MSTSWWRDRQEGVNYWHTQEHRWLTPIILAAVCLKTGIGLGRGRLQRGGARKLGGMMDEVIIFTSVMASEHLHVLRFIKLCVKYMRVTVSQLYLNKLTSKKGKHILIFLMTSQASRSSICPSVPHMQWFQCFLLMLVHTGVFLNHGYVDISFP